MATETVPVRAVADLRTGLEYRLGAMLRAAQLLANHQRVHSAITDGADDDPALTEKLGQVCSDWKDPTSWGGGDILADLLGVACVELNNLVGESDALIEHASRSSGATKRGAACAS